MRGKKYMAALVFVVLSGFIAKDVFGFENYDIFNDILGKTNSVAVETGMTVYYDTKNEGRTECINWLKGMHLYNTDANFQNVMNSCLESRLLMTKADICTAETYYIGNSSRLINNITLNDNKTYCREFQNKSVYGYIESRKEENNTKIEIYIRKLSNKNEICDLYNKVNNCISRESTNIFSYKYLKCRNNKEDVSQLQHKIKQLLFKLGAENMTEVNINNGCSASAYIKQYTPIKDNGKLIDMNYAVLKGNGENYIIIATPIIDITY